MNKSWDRPVAAMWFLSSTQSETWYVESSHVSLTLLYGFPIFACDQFKDPLCLVRWLPWERIMVYHKSTTWHLSPPVEWPARDWNHKTLGGHSMVFAMTCSWIFCCHGPWRSFTLIPKTNAMPRSQVLSQGSRSRSPALYSNMLRKTCVAAVAQRSCLSRCLQG